VLYLLKSWCHAILVNVYLLSVHIEYSIILRMLSPRCGLEAKKYGLGLMTTGNIHNVTTGLALGLMDVMIWASYGLASSPRKSRRRPIMRSNKARMSDKILEELIFTHAP